MTLLMPKPEQAILSKRAEIVMRLEAIVAPGNVLADERQMRPYECDAITMYRQLPMVVVLPETVAEVSQILALAKELNVKIVPRGGGTSLSGGSMPLEDGILLAMGKFNKILEIDYENRCAIVQPGVANLAISKAVEDEGSTTRRTHPRRSPARSAAMWARIPAASIA
jgi:FAD/FMN-containing dehydrogenases